MYADILINHPYARSQESLSYEVPEVFLEQGSEEAIKVGDGVLVPFQRGEQVGIVIRLHDEKPDFKTRPIKAFLEEKELISDWQMQLAEWISEYYFCSRLDVLKSMLPKHIWRKPKQKRKAPKATTKQSKKAVWHPLTPEQEQVIQGILKDKPAVSLIHGITGAGKTEIYKNLIKDTIEKVNKPYC